MIVSTASGVGLNTNTFSVLSQSYACGLASGMARPDNFVFDRGALYDGDLRPCHGINGNSLCHSTVGSLNSLGQLKTQGSFIHQRISRCAVVPS